MKKAYLKAITYGFAIAVFAFLMFQLLPRQIISIFGDGSAEYYQFAVSYFRIFLLFTFLNFMQPITSNFFTAIGKPTKGMFLSLTRQIIFLLPLIVVLPMLIGIDGDSLCRSHRRLYGRTDRHCHGSKRTENVKVSKSTRIKIFYLQ